MKNLNNSIDWKAIIRSSDRLIFRPEPTESILGRCGPLGKWVAPFEEGFLA
jgi:hypothetical protein